MMKYEDVLTFEKQLYLPTPRYLQIEITNRCDMLCPQCYKGSFEPKDMSAKMFDMVMSDAQCIGVNTVTLNGGEPFKHSEFYNIIDILKKYHLKTYTFTSGDGITDGKIDTIYSDGLDILLFVSLNGSTQEINMLSRDGYDIAIEAMSRLKRKGKRYGVNWVCRHDNVYDFPNMLSLCKKLHASSINIVANKLSGTGNIHSELTSSDYLFLKRYIENQVVVKPSYITIQHCYNVLNKILKRPVNAHLNMCGAGALLCCVTVDGDYTPCTHLYFAEKAVDISDYWNHSSILHQLRNSRLQKKKCIDCSVSSACFFCKAMHLETSLDFKTEPNYCAIKYIVNEENCYVKNI
ncbi:MAG: radical SAM protein [Clostridium sp.]|nr:radical SAM protein [Clostridium sp.]